MHSLPSTARRNKQYAVNRMFSLFYPLVVLHVLIHASTTHATQPISYDDLIYISNLLSLFEPQYQQLTAQCPDSIQFAVMTIGRLDSNQLSPIPPYFQEIEHVDQTYNFFAAVPQRTGRYTEHAEEQLISAFSQMVPYYAEIPADVYIYTTYSPCIRCARALQQLARDNPDTNFHIGFIEPWVNPHTDQNTLPLALPYLEEPNIFVGDLGGQCSTSTYTPRTDLRKKRTSTNCNFPCDVCTGWTSWGICSHTCGGGTQYRYRYCLVGFSFPCCEPARQEVRCNTQGCPSCFASDSIVRVKLLTNNGTRIERKRIDELKVGDYVESYDEENNSVAFSEVYFISHDGYTGNSSRLLKLILGYNHGKEQTLRLHSKHLVYACQSKKYAEKKTGYKEKSCRYPPMNPVTAESVQVGDIMWMKNKNGEFSPKTVINISETWSEVRHPMTLNHYIVVDDVLASVHMYDEGLYRKLTAPIRFLYGISPSITDTMVVKKLVQMWDSIEENFL